VPQPLGISTSQDERGILVSDVDPKGTAAAAGVKVGDYLLALNDISVTDPGFGVKFRATIAQPREGQPITIRVMRGQLAQTLTGALKLVPGGIELSADPAASPKAARIRAGILRGVTGSGQ